MFFTAPFYALQIGEPLSQNSSRSSYFLVRLGDKALRLKDTRHRLLPFDDRLDNLQCLVEVVESDVRDLLLYAVNVEIALVIGFELREEQVGVLRCGHVWMDSNIISIRVSLETITAR